LGGRLHSGGPGVEPFPLRAHSPPRYSERLIRRVAGAPGFLQDSVAQGETLDLEFKSEHLRSLSDAELVEAVVCLANRSGERSGWLLVRQFDAICPPPVRAFSAADIKRLRERLNFSQPVFAHLLHTTASTVRKWEQGDTRPAGPALKLLNVIADKGLETVL
jgi:putative transcriptional regulator